MKLFVNNKLAVAGLTVAITVAVVIYCVTTQKPQSQSNIIDKVISLPTLENSLSSVRVVHPSKPEKGLLIYVADTKSEKETTENAKQFAALSYYVAVINNDSLFTKGKAPENCLNVAQKLTSLSEQLLTHFNIDESELPILVGTNTSSATLYVALAQLQEHKFHAAISVNFNSKIKRQGELCNQQEFLEDKNGNTQFKAVKRLPSSFYIFQENSLADEVAFTKNIGNVKLTQSESKETKAEAIQILQWLDPRLADQTSSDSSDGDLPLIEVQDDLQQTEKTPVMNDTFAIILTGDGGWAEIDKQIAKILANQGIPTVALDSLSYFWKARTPVETATDIETTIQTYLAKWNKQKVILIGYSFGADVLPFVANKLTPETQQKISSIALLGMGKTAAFEFRLSSWMNADKNPDRLPLLPEIEKMKWANSICIYGVKDDAANCLPTVELGVKAISMPGDHHFDERYEELVNHILDSAAAKKPAQQN